MELSLREVLGIAKKEFHDSIVDLVNRKRLSTETEPKKSVDVRTTHIEDMVLEETSWRKATIRGRTEPERPRRPP